MTKRNEKGGKVMDQYFGSEVGSLGFSIVIAISGLIAAIVIGLARFSRCGLRVEESIPGRSIGGVAAVVSAFLAFTLISSSSDRIYLFAEKLASEEVVGLVFSLIVVVAVMIYAMVLVIVMELSSILRLSIIKAQIRRILKERERRNKETARLRTHKR